MTENRFNDPQNDLLLQLQEASGCSYMSDLHLSVYRKCIRDAVGSIRAAAYPVQAWNAALRYIAGDVPPYDDADSAKAFLLAFLDQSNM